ncbi:MAG: PRC-barrel domain-containing protein [Acidobacteriota bacterium]|nr:PRC-barrel domain-containing protein [Acidobacteriota bacterium]
MVAATDGEIGHIDDFLLDDESAKIRYAVVVTKNWLPGKHILIAPEWIREIKWSESKVFVNATREAVRNSPEYNPVTPVDKEYESRLFTHYGYPVTWL